MTATKNKLETTVGELVTERPARARIFESFAIDYCFCGRPIEQQETEESVPGG